MLKITVKLKDEHNNTDTIELIMVKQSAYVKTNFNYAASKRTAPIFVGLNHHYWLSKYLVTNKQWGLIMGKKNDKENDNLPIVGISWDEAMEFCGKMNDLYKNEIPEGYTFSLPSEFQWEAVVRNGFVFDVESESYLNEFSKYAWYKENSDNQLKPVGEKLPNLLGFYDIIGNCFNWCLDEFCEYPKERAIDWIGKNEKLKMKVIKGFSYKTPINDPSINIGSRGYHFGSTTHKFCGIRLALTFSGNDLEK